MADAPFDVIDPIEPRLADRVRSWADRAVEPIDAAAIAQAAAATVPAHRQRRTRLMSTATRLIVVTAIVSLGTGVLLLSTGGPSPVPVASPSPTPATPFAGWVTEEVEPGVVRVLSDGIRDVSPAGDQDRHELAIGTDGSIWLSVTSKVEARTEQTGTLVRLGDPAAYPVDGIPNSRDYGELDLRVDPDGSPRALTDAGLMHLDEDGWFIVDGSPKGPYDIALDGTVWQASKWPYRKEGGIVDIARRWTGSGWEAHPIDVDLAAALGVDADVIAGVQVKGYSAAPDGSVWVGLAVQYHDPSPNEDGFGHLLLRFDGETWSVIDPMGIGSYFDMAHFDIGADGTAWVYLDTGDATDPHLARLSGGEWTVYDRDDGVTPIGIRGEVPGYLEVAPDGTAWMHQLMDGPGRCRGVRSFDGSSWRRYLDGTCVVDLDIAPDGSVWVTGAKDPAWGHPAPDTGDTYRIEPAS